MEIVVPVEREELKADLKHFLSLELSDTIKAHVLQSDGNYEKPDKRGKRPLNSQKQLCREARDIAKKRQENMAGRVFVPETKPADETPDTE